MLGETKARPSSPRGTLRTCRDISRVRQRLERGLITRRSDAVSLLRILKRAAMKQLNQIRTLAEIFPGAFSDEPATLSGPVQHLADRLVDAVSLRLRSLSEISDTRTDLERRILRNAICDIV